jgi:protease I
MKSLIITYDKFQDHEVVYPYYRLTEEGEVDIMSHAIGRIYGILGTNMNSDYTTKELNENLLTEYDLLVLPGGVKAMEKLRQEKNVIEFISQWNAMGKVIACTCSGAQLLISAKVVKDRKISAYYAMEDDVTNAGAIYSPEPVVIDSNIVTSPHYDFMGPWLRTAIDMVKNGQTSRNS